jgi:hypothetical protein
LFFVGKVLVLASAAVAEAWAQGRDPIWRRMQDFEQIGVRTIFIVSIDACFDGFARESEWHKDDPAVDAADARAEIG